MEDKENFVEICRNASILDVTAVMEALENGADVNEKELDTKSTGLMMAVQKNSEPLVSLPPVAQGHISTRGGYHPRGGNPPPPP